MYVTPVAPLPSSRMASRDPLGRTRGVATTQPVSALVTRWPSPATVRKDGLRHGDSGRLRPTSMPTRGRAFKSCSHRREMPLFRSSIRSSSWEPLRSYSPLSSQLAGSSCCRHQIQAAADFRGRPPAPSPPASPEGATIEPLKKSDRFDLVIQLARALPPFPRCVTPDAAGFQVALARSRPLAAAVRGTRRRCPMSWRRRA